ncbi:MAG: hypothetical protein RIB86_15125, partial [Imperialibacter sp.]
MQSSQACIKSHASEIEYCIGNLYLVDNYAWKPDDFKVSETRENFFANSLKPAITHGLCNHSSHFMGDNDCDLNALFYSLSIFLNPYNVRKGSSAIELLASQG